MAKPLRRMTNPTRAVLSVFMEAPIDEHYGLDVAAAADIRSGSLYPILSRLEDHGWLVSRWEEIDPSEKGRPRRRYYKLTADGMNLARAALSSPAPGLLRWVAGGTS